MIAKIDPLRAGNGGADIFPTERMSARCRAFYNDSKVLDDFEAINIAARIMGERMKPPAIWKLANQPATLDWILHNTGKKRTHTPGILGFDFKRNFTDKNTAERIAVGQPLQLINQDVIDLAKLIDMGVSVTVHGLSPRYPGRSVMVEIRSNKTTRKHDRP